MEAVLLIGVGGSFDNWQIPPRFANYPEGRGRRKKKREKKKRRRRVSRVRDCIYLDNNHGRFCRETEKKAVQGIWKKCTLWNVIQRRVWTEIPYSRDFLEIQDKRKNLTRDWREAWVCSIFRILYSLDLKKQGKEWEWTTLCLDRLFKPKVSSSGNQPQAWPSPCCDIGFWTCLRLEIDLLLPCLAFLKTYYLLNSVCKWFIFPPLSLSKGQKQKNRTGMCLVPRSICPLLHSKLNQCVWTMYVCGSSAISN